MKWLNEREKQHQRVKNASDDELGDAIEEAYECLRLCRESEAAGKPKTEPVTYIPAPSMLQQAVRYMYLFDNNFNVSDRVLEIGCGSGVLSSALVMDGCKVTAVEVKRTTLTKAKEHFAKLGVPIDFQCTVGENISVDDGTFDVAFATEVLEHIRDLDRFSTELHRVLKPGGLFYLTTPVGRAADSFDHLQHFNTQDELIAALPSFKPVTIYTFRAFPNSRRPSGWLAKFQRID